MGSRDPGEGQCSPTHATHWQHCPLGQAKEVFDPVKAIAEILLEAECAIKKSKVKGPSMEIQFLGLSAWRRGATTHHTIAPTRNKGTALLTPWAWLGDKTSPAARRNSELARGGSVTDWTPDKAELPRYHPTTNSPTTLLRWPKALLVHWWVLQTPKQQRLWKAVVWSTLASPTAGLRSAGGEQQP